MPRPLPAVANGIIGHHQVHMKQVLYPKTMSNDQYNYIQSYVHNNQIGVLVEYGMDSSFTARVADVKALMSNVALHIAACDPEDVEELLSQSFVKEPDKKVSDAFMEVSETVSEKVAVIRFVRWDTVQDRTEPDGPPSEPSTNVVYIRGTR